MELPDLKDLGKVIDLCRRKGVSAIQIGTLRLELGNEPIAPKRAYNKQNSTPETDPEDKWSGFPTGELTPEQLMYYSAGGAPENDPTIGEA